MLNRFLKKARIVLSLLFFFSICISFLDLTGLLSPLFSVVPVYLQFIPSFFRFAEVISIGGAGFIIVLLLTLLFGRVYCSSICPFGTLQDLFSYFRKKLSKRKYFIYLKDYRLLKFSFLAATIIPLFAGSMFTIDMLDPFSNIGKILSNIFRPALIICNNLIAYPLNKAGVYFISAIDIKGFAVTAFLFSVSLLLIIGYMSFKHGRLFCNSVCPVGTLLGLISKHSFIKIRINRESCKSCNLCEHVCKAGCIDKKSKEVDNERCVSCFNCLQVCPQGGINYSYALLSKQNNDQINKQRRDILVRTGLFALSFCASTYSQIKVIPKKASRFALNKKNAATPPGSLSIDHFTGHCTSCHLCVSACPTQVLQPSLFEYGLSGFLQPFMDYRGSFCNQECTVCTEICPSGAITKVTKEQKKLIQIGKVQFEKRNCVVETEGTECGACSEHCPTKAVNMVPYKGKLHIPEVESKYCTGCGACEFACPVKPFKAIYVEGNSVHLTAEIRKQEKLKDKIDYKEEFPF